MKRMHRINKLLLNKFGDFTIKIIDNSHLHVNHGSFDGRGETHIKIILKSKRPQKINRLLIHKSINNILFDEFKSGLHSLEINIT